MIINTMQLSYLLKMYYRVAGYKAPALSQPNNQPAEEKQPKYPDKNKNLAAEPVY
jgi:hypothetical protein